MRVVAGRGASRFAWDEERSMMCASARRHLLLFHYNGSEFVDLKDLGLPDAVLAMAWCGDSVCLGFKKE
jgi:Vam6/Vps39-like protein vacuolar protein sorting-associated protein 39